RKCWKCSLIGIIFAIGCRSPFQERLSLVRQSQLTPSRLLHNQRYVTSGRWCSLVRKRAKRAIIASQETQRFARLAQILRCAKNACSRMTIKLHNYRRTSPVAGELPPPGTILNQYARRLIRCARSPVVRRRVPCHGPPSVRG